MLIFLILIASVLLLWAILIFNMLVRDRNRVHAAWSDIDVQLNRRYDLIPRLVEAVKQYAKYEQSSFEAITELRAQAQNTAVIADKGPLEGELGTGVLRLIAVAESYPDLRASENFLSLQRDLVEVENHIQYARRYYNGAVRELNTRIDRFPDLIIARQLRFRHEDYFELESADKRETPMIGQS